MMARNFDGISDYYTFGSSENMDGANNGTQGVLSYATQDAASASNERIFSTPLNGTGVECSLRTRPDTGQAEWRLQDGGTWSAIYDFGAAYTMLSNAWAILAASWDFLTGTSREVNRAQHAKGSGSVSSGTATDTSTGSVSGTTTTPAVIGRDHGAAQFQWDGRIGFLCVHEAHLDPFKHRAMALQIDPLMVMDPGDIFAMIDFRRGSQLANLAGPWGAPSAVGNPTEDDDHVGPHGRCVFNA